MTGRECGIRYRVLDPPWTQDSLWIHLPAMYTSGCSDSCSFEALREYWTPYQLLCSGQ